MEQANGKRMTDNRQTHFGFQTVDEDQKAGMVHQVFSSVASKYDVMNDLMSVGIHRVWKTAMMDWLAPRDGQHLLDVAGGTGEAMALPFADNSFDRYTISFGIRNVTRIPDALAEAYRVLKPGGRLMVLEFSQIPVPAMQWAYDRYSFNVIPAMGQAVTGDRDSYQYLVESIRKFPDQDSFAALIRDAGFDRVQWRNLSMGIAALHSGWKL